MKRGNSEDLALTGEAKHYIAAHLHKPLTLQSIADGLYVSRTRLCMIFKRTTGHSIGHYIRELRIKRAQTLMFTTDDSLGDIAQQVGYQRQGSFSEVFKEMVGCTPTEWRLKNLSDAN